MVLSVDWLLLAGLAGVGEPLLQLTDIPDHLDPSMEQLPGVSWGALWAPC